MEVKYNIVIYTSLKSSAGRVAGIQARTMENWRECFPACEVVDAGEERRFDKCVERLKPGAAAAWINADILFNREEVARVRQWMMAVNHPFLIVGQRTDMLPGGQRELHRPSGLDYFFFTKETFDGLPPVVMGRSYCDSALVAHCLRRGIQVVDATKVVTALHQWHDYAHVAGGRSEVFGGEEAQANRRNNRLRNFGPHIADVRCQFLAKVEVEGEQTSCSLLVVKRHVPLLRRLGMWSLWNRVTRGGIGFWGIHEYVGKNGCRYFTRSKVEWWSPNSNVRMRFKQVVDAPKGIWTGFDFPCMWHAWHEREVAKSKGFDLQWTVFLWDPPCLSHRDKFLPLRWAIDFVFRWFTRRCDKLVLNIHPGLLGEIGFGRVEVEKWRASGKLELRMQDAFDGLVPPRISTTTTFNYDFGVLSNWTKAKGSELMIKVMRLLPGRSCLWIGDPPNSNIQAIRDSNISFAGRLNQEEAFEKLRKCRVLVAPYLNVHSLKWNYVLKLFEYVQLGRPILASDNSGNVEVAKRFPDRITLFRSGDAADFVEKVRTVLEVS